MTRKSPTTTIPPRHRPEPRPCPSRRSSVPHSRFQPHDAAPDDTEPLCATNPSTHEYTPILTSQAQNLLVLSLTLLLGRIPAVVSNTILTFSVVHARWRIRGHVEQFPRSDQHGSEVVSLEVRYRAAGRHQGRICWTTIRFPRHILVREPNPYAAGPPFHGLISLARSLLGGQLVGLLARTGCACGLCCWYCAGNVDQAVLAGGEFLRCESAVRQIQP